MFEFIVAAIIAIVVANIITTALACAIMLNRRVLKAYTKYVMKVSTEIAEEAIDEMYK